MKALTIILGTLCLAGCSKADAPPPPATAAAATAAGPAVASAPGDACPATGQWAECSLLYRLSRAGLVVKIDSGASPQEKELGGQAVTLKLGQTAALELHIYPDSVTRIADEKKLNRADFVSADAEQTMKRERTLIESMNVLGLLTSFKDRQRERVSDAITAGAPQPAAPVKIGNPSKP